MWTRTDGFYGRSHYCLVFETKFPRTNCQQLRHTSSFCINSELKEPELAKLVEYLYAQGSSSIKQQQGTEFIQGSSSTTPHEQQLLNHIMMYACTGGRFFVPSHLVAACKIVQQMQSSNRIRRLSSKHQAISCSDAGIVELSTIDTNEDPTKRGFSILNVVTWWLD